MDTHQEHRKSRQIFLEDKGPPKMLPASRGFHATFLKFARQFQQWFMSINGAVHSQVFEQRGLGRFPPCNWPWFIPLARVEEASYPACNCRSRNHYVSVVTQMRSTEITHKMGSDEWKTIYPEVDNRPIAEECISTPRQFRSEKRIALRQSAVRDGNLGVIYEDPDRQRHPRWTP
eukprot:2516434-Karenia_brevis.AAC.2